MSKATKRKIVRQEVCDPESWEPPGPGRALARVLAGRGNNLHEVMVAGEIPPTRSRLSSPHVVGKVEVNSSIALSTSDLKTEDLVLSEEGGSSNASDCLTKTSSATNSSSGGDAKVSLTSEDWSEKRILASMPSKFRRSVWVRRGDVVVIEWIPEGDKVKAEIVSVLLRKMVRMLRMSGELEWPPEFDHTDFGDVEKLTCETDSSDENEDDLPANTNRRPLPVVSNSSSSSSTSSSSDDDESDTDDDDDEGEGGEAAGSVFENPNRRTVSRSLSKSNSSSDEKEGENGKGDVILNLNKDLE
ncbi:suppressor protein SRP40 [Ischnura elegans]|uniref:suppressor protein SRP40 n=1 Tax=Ischnura elegans TaxID=197161 RepID=UPI001ED8AEDB|nr:suppressor protein SRP40 [Ischnura elegans]